MRMMLIDDCGGHDLDRQKVDDHEDDVDDCNGHELDEHEGDYGAWVDHHEVDDQERVLIDDCDGHDLDQQEVDDHEDDDGAWVDHHEVDDHVEDHYDHLQICKR